MRNTLEKIAIFKIHRNTWVSYLKKTNTWAIHEQCMRNTCQIHELKYMRNTWEMCRAYLKYMKYTCDIHEKYMRNTWEIHGHFTSVCCY